MRNKQPGTFSVRMTLVIDDEIKEWLHEQYVKNSRTRPDQIVHCIRLVMTQDKFHDAQNKFYNEQVN